MSQVRKYQTGGTTPITQNNSNKNRGTFTIDGTTYDITDDFINELYNYGKSITETDPDAAYQFNNIIDSAKRAANTGENITYNSTNNSLTGNINFDVNDRQSENMRRRRSRFGNRLINTLNTNEANAKKAIGFLKDFKYNTPKTIHNWNKELNLNYAVDENNNRIFSPTTTSLALINRLNSLKDISNYSDSDIFNGYNNAKKEDYIRIYNELGEEGIQELIDRIKKGTISDSDELLLNSIGGIVTSNNETPDEEQQTKKEEDARKQQYKDLGFDYDTVSKYITIDKEGRMFITDDFRNILDQNGVKNQMFNDNFFEVAGNEYTPFTWLKGFTRYGNRLYKTSDINKPGTELYDITHNQTKFYNYNTQGKYIDANKIIEYLYGREYIPQTYDSTTHYSSYLNPLVEKNPNLLYYTIPIEGKDPNYEQLITWAIPGAEGNQLNDLGQIQFQNYALLDGYGNVIKTWTPEDKKAGKVNWVESYLNNQKDVNDAEGLRAQEIVEPSNRESDYYGRYRIEQRDPNNNRVLGTLYVNKNDPSDVIWSSDILSNTISRLGNNNNTNSIRIPKEMMEIINTNPNFWKNLFRDRSIQEKFINGLSRTIGYRGWRTNDLSVNDLINLGFNKETANKLKNMFSSVYYDPSDRFQRRIDYIVPMYESPIPETSEVQTFQQGGTINKPKEVVSVNKTNNYKHSKDITKSAGTEQGGWWDLTSADKWQIASLAGDIASLLTAVPTGGNPIAAATGYGSTAAQLVADIKKDGFQARDLTNLLVNLGLDTITLLPGLGITGKAGKLVKSLKSVSNILKPLFYGAGLKAAYQGVDNLINGKGSWEDWSSVLQGLMSFKGIKNDIQVRKMTTPIKTTSPKSKESIKQDILSGRLKKNKELIETGKKEGWVDKDGKIIDWEKAEANIQLTNADKVRLNAEATSSKFKNKAEKTLNSLKWWNLDQRTLKDNIDFDNLTSSQLRTLARAQQQSKGVRDRLNQLELELTPINNFNSPYKESWFYRAPILKQKQTIETPKQTTETPKETTIFNVSDKQPFKINPIIKFSKENIKISKSDKKPNIITFSSPKENNIVTSNYFPYLSSYPLVRKNNYLLNPTLQQKQLSIDNNIDYIFDSKGNLIWTEKPIIRRYFDKYKLNPTLQQKQLIYKKGGKIDKIIKGEFGIKTSIINDPTDPNFVKTELVEEKWNGPKINFDSKVLSWYKPTQSTQPIQTTSSINPAESTPPTNWGFLDEEKDWPMTKYDYVAQGLRLGEWINSNKSINKYFDNQLKANDILRRGTQITAPSEIYPNYSDYGLNRMYNNQLNNIRNYKSIGNDQQQLLADRRNRDIIANQITDNYNLQSSQSIDKYNLENLNRKDTYNRIRADVANQNRQNNAKYLANKYNLNAAKVNMKSTNLNEWFQQLSGDHALDMEEREKALFAKNQLINANKLQKELEEKFNWANVQDKEKYNNSVYQYALQTNPTEYNSIAAKYNANNYIDWYNQGFSHSPFGRNKLKEYEIKRSYTPINRDTIIEH